MNRNLPINDVSPFSFHNNKKNNNGDDDDDAMMIFELQSVIN